MPHFVYSKIFVDAVEIQSEDQYQDITFQLVLDDTVHKGSGKCQKSDEWGTHFALHIY